MSTAHRAREKQACEPIAKSKSTHGSSKKPSSSGHKIISTISTKEVPPKRRADSHSSQDRAKPHTKRRTSPNYAEQNSDREETTAYLNKQLQAKLLSRKKEEVDRFMAVFTEWLDRKLEPFEAPCDGEGCDPSSSRGSSAKRKGGGGQGKRQVAGKKRQLEKDDSNDNDDHEGEDDDDRQPDGSYKRSKPDPNVPRWACPYRQYAPSIFNRKRTCCGPGWENLHRLKEHLHRVHKLPEWECNRCLEPFAKKELWIDHQRAATPCKIREVVRRDLTEGFDKSQADQLAKVRTGPSHEKWIKWFCILFGEDPESLNLPSPYQGDPAGTDWREGHTDRSRYGPVLALIKNEVTKQVRSFFNSRLEEGVLGLQPRLRSDVVAEIPSITASVQRVVQANPTYSGVSTANGEGSTHEMPPDFDPYLILDPSSLLANLENNLVQGDAFDFNSLESQEPSQGQVYQPVVDYSSSYLSDGTHGTAQSSNTSVEENIDGNSKIQGQYQTLKLPQQFAMPPSHPYGQQYC